MRRREDWPDADGPPTEQLHSNEAEDANLSFAALLDVDNGPNGMSCSASDWPYDRRGLRAAHTALRPGGVLSVWSSGPDRSFAGRLGKAGFSVEEVKARSKIGGGARHVIWIATRGG